MNTELTLGSLFDGSGGFPLGGLLSGITPVWASEIEPFPIRVTSKRLPQMKHYGDIPPLTAVRLNPWILSLSAHPVPICRWRATEPVLTDISPFFFTKQSESSRK